jgi:broad-specificity NMP kinase
VRAPASTWHAIFREWRRLTCPRFRDYAESKVQENVEAEIMQVIGEEARESYQEDIILVGLFF